MSDKIIYPEKYDLDCGSGVFIEWFTGQDTTTRIGFILSHQREGHLCQGGCMLRGQENKDEHPSWIMTGSFESPTFEPSIKCLCGINFHGYIKNGLWEPCK